VADYRHGFFSSGDPVDPLNTSRPDNLAFTQAAKPAALLLLLAGLWMLAHPYHGIRHDGSLYLGQALLHIAPESFSRDLFFMFGSQDRYSIFSRVYAWLIESFGVGTSARGLLILTHAAFALSVFALLSRLYPQPVLWFSFVVVCCAPAYYGSYSVFAYAESFLTARSLAEPLLLLSLWQLLSERYVRALLLCAVAGTLHPLLTLPVIVLIWVYLCMKDRRLVLLGLAGLAVPLLGGFGLAPFDALFRTYDEEWLGVVERRNAFVILGKWSYFDWARLAFDFAMVSLAAFMLSGNARRLHASALVTAALGLGAAFIGTDLLSNVLITGLQTWRAHWLLHLLSMASLPFVLYKAWRSDPNGRLAASLIIVAFCGLRFPPVLLGLALGAALLLAPARKIVLSPLITRWLAHAALIVAVVAAADQTALSHHSRVELRGDPADAFAVLQLAAPWTGSALLALFLYWRYRVPLAAMGMALVLAATGAMWWDQRSPWLRYMENGEHREHPFASFIAPDKQVYWFHELLAAWVVLKRSSYIAAGQGSGALFNRDTALEYERRLEAVGPLGFQDATCMMMARLTGDRDGCGLTLEAAADTCKQANGLDFLVIENSLDIPAIQTWTFRPETGKPRTFHLYGCQQMRDD